MDFSVFKDNQTDFCRGYRQCTAINRLLIGLQYFSSLDIDKDENKFCAFMNDIYKNVINDWTHLQLIHNDNEQIERIHSLMVAKECPMNGCEATRRHFDESNVNIQNDATLNLYVSLFDSLHFWLFHSFDAGFRVKQNENENLQNSELFDAEFNRINAIVRKSDFKTEPFERISSDNNSKFTISTTEQGDMSFLDELYKHLRSELIHIEILRKFVEKEEYDSDSIKTLASKYPHILMSTVNKECVESIQRFIKETKGITATSNFSVGLRLYYWKHYKKMDELPTCQQMISIRDNTHDHGGHKVSELCVDGKYGSFKEEAMNYPNFTKEQYEAAWAKAIIYHRKSDRIKEITAKYTDGYEEMFLYYGIEFGDFLLFGHILALILYTDFSKLCTVFSSTFRQMHNFETLKSIKTRNALFYWMSRRLRELVELFGQCSIGDWDKEKKKAVDQMKGPFYCGMNTRLNIYSFAMRLNSPTSTSKHFPVAVKFSGPQGAVFTFANSGTSQYHYLRCFNCSILSAFPEEDECLFFGGFYRIKVVTLRIIETKRNMEKFVSAIFEFDHALSGGWPSKKVQDVFLIVHNLINIRLKKKSKKVILPPFIIDCFHAFVENKKQIVFDLYHLFKFGNPNINKLLFHCKTLDQRDANKEFKRSDDDSNNLVRSETFVLFRKVRRLIIQSTFNESSFSFSLLAFLNSISGTNLDEIIIKSDENWGNCWIKSVWDSDEEILKNKYTARGYEIKIKREEGEYNLRINKQ